MPFTENERQVLYEDIKKTLQHQIIEALHEAELVPNEVYQTVRLNLDNSKGE